MRDVPLIVGMRARTAAVVVAAVDGMDGKSPDLLLEDLEERNCDL